MESLTCQKSYSLITKQRQYLVFLANNCEDELKEFEAKKNTLRKQEAVMFYGKLAKYSPQDLEVTSAMIAHVTNAKAPIKQKKDRPQVRIED